MMTYWGAILKAYATRQLDRLEVEGTPGTSENTTAASEAGGIVDRQTLPGIEANINTDRTVEGAEATLHAANRIGGDLHNGQVLPGFFVGKGGAIFQKHDPSLG
jgi:hypothetical protein